MARPEKIAMVNDIQEKLQAATSVIVTNYSGLNVAEVNELRKELREAGVEYKVLKNTLVSRAIDKTENEEYSKLKDVLVGPTAIAFSEDPVAAAKVLHGYSKKSAKKLPEIKAGVIEGKVIDLEKVNEIANIPSREELLAKMLGSLNAPITNFVGVLAALPRGLVCALDGIRQKKEEN